MFYQWEQLEILFHGSDLEMFLREMIHKSRSMAFIVRAIFAFEAWILTNCLKFKEEMKRIIEIEIVFLIK